MEVADFNINIARLKIGSHTFQYKLNEEFLNHFYPELVEKANLQVDLALLKSETMVEISFDLQGEVEIVCDRSLEVFPEPIEVKERLFFKFGEEAQELSDDVVIISTHQHEIDLSQYVYEFVALAIPMKKLHPKFRNEADEEESLIYTSRKQQEDESSEPVDPRWEALKHINKNK